MASKDHNNITNNNNRRHYQNQTAVNAISDNTEPKVEDKRQIDDNEETMVSRGPARFALSNTERLEGGGSAAN
jgi:hypothetical protein